MEEQTNDAKKPKPTKKTRRFYAFLAFTAFVVLIAAVSVIINHKNQQARPRVAEVRITASGFEPSTLVVEQGTKITWVNTDSRPHQVMANPYPKGSDLPNLKSEILNNAQTYSYFADRAGSFNYHDQINPTVNGTIVIQKE